MQKTVPTGAGTPNLRHATPAERRRIVYEVYAVLARKFPDNDNVTYSLIHDAVHKLQPKLREQYRVDLGYRFEARNFFGPWDHDLQEDIIILDARGMVDNHDDSEPVISHNLRPTLIGEDSARGLAKLRRKKYLFGTSRDALRRDVQQVLATDL